MAHNCLDTDLIIVIKTEFTVLGFKGLSISVIFLIS